MQQKWRIKMEIGNFVEMVKTNVEKILGKEYEITVKKSEKNNGVIYTGLSIRKIGLSVAPLIYLNEHFEKYNSGCITIEETVEYVIKFSKSKCPIAIGSQFLNYDSARKNIVYRLIKHQEKQGVIGGYSSYRIFGSFNSLPLSDYRRKLWFGIHIDT